MKKHLLISMLLAASTMAQAGTLGASTAGATMDIDSAACGMVQTSFNLKLSQNVGAAWTCNTTTAAVNAGSTKGKYAYGGSTSGGTVASCGTTPDPTNGYNLTPGAVDNGCQ